MHAPPGDDTAALRLARRIPTFFAATSGRFRFRHRSLLPEWRCPRPLLCKMSGGLLKALRSDSYVELSQYRDQHFWVREAGPREGKALGQNTENRFTLVSCRLPFSSFPKPEVRPRCLLGNGC